LGTSGTLPRRSSTDFNALKDLLRSGHARCLQDPHSLSAIAVVESQECSGMDIRPIAQDSWAAELDGFSRRHEGWLVSIKRRAPDGSISAEAHDVPLVGVSPMSPDSNDIAVTVGDADNHLTHDVHDAIALRLELTADRAERALAIDAKDGSTTSIEFRSPIRVEEVDGLPAPDRISQRGSPVR